MSWYQSRTDTPLTLIDNHNTDLHTRRWQALAESAWFDRMIKTLFYHIIDFLMSKDICCPKFDPKRWEGKTHKRTKKPFIMESIPTFFHIPFPPMIGWKTTKMCKMMEDAKMAEAVSSLYCSCDDCKFIKDISLSGKSLSLILKSSPVFKSILNRVPSLL